MKYNRSDWIGAALISLFLLVLTAGYMTTGVTDWGDDFAAYLNEGFAIADGTFDDQIALNYEQHPTPLPDEANDEKLVYVWGFPLVHALVYRLAGFDRVNYSTVILYKIPVVLSLSLTGGVLFLFFRRRFNGGISAFLSLLFCVSGDLFIQINRLYSDLFFLFISFLAPLLMECYADHSEKWGLGICYGIVLWMTRETRLNGMTICAVAALGHILALSVHTPNDEKNTCFNWKRLADWRNFMPYILCILLSVITEHLWLAPATSNLSDVGMATGSGVWENIQYYRRILFDYFCRIPYVRIPAVGYISIGLMVTGIIIRTLKGNAHLTLLLLGTLIVLVMLPYQQGLRYVYSILPFMLMFIAYGAIFFTERIQKAFSGFRKLSLVASVIVTAIAGEMLFFPCAAAIVNDYINLTHWGEKTQDDVYNDDAIEVYAYIQQNISEESMIAFAKPRALFLNTGRRSFRPGINGHDVMDAGYFLYCKLKYGDFEDIQPSTLPLTVVLDNEVFTLYEIKRQSPDGRGSVTRET